MLFNSYVFILLFFPICLIGYFSLNQKQYYRTAMWFLFVASLIFYGYFNPWYTIIIIGSIMANYAIYICTRKAGSSTNQFKRKLPLIIGLVFNLGLLFYFKYTDFFIDTLNKVAQTHFPLLGIALPLGISFFTFQQISFVIDAYRGQIDNYNFLEYASFVAYFPQLIAGPIVTHDELIPQFRDKSKKHINWDNFSRGLYIFVLGLAKKVLIADRIGNVANNGWSNIAGLNSTEAIVTMLCYTIQIYFDFSGYCDMAIGIGKMMNLDLPINFNSPYKATTIKEFWDRWHMTLTRFFTRYVYIPLGGNRKGKVRTYINIFIVFFLSGFWHGAGFTFIIWGIGHGIFSILTRMFKNTIYKIPGFVRWIITFCIINALWVFFRAPSINDAFLMFAAIGKLNFGKVNITMLENGLWSYISTCLSKLFAYNIYFDRRAITIYLVSIILAIIGYSALGKNAYDLMKKFKPNYKNLLAVLIILGICVFSFSQISQFLYFDF